MDLGSRSTSRLGVVWSRVALPVGSTCHGRRRGDVREVPCWALLVAYRFGRSLVLESRDDPTRRLPMGLGWQRPLSNHHTSRVRKLCHCRAHQYSFWLSRADEGLHGIGGIATSLDVECSWRVLQRRKTRASTRCSLIGVERKKDTVHVCTSSAIRMLMRR